MVEQGLKIRVFVITCMKLTRTNILEVSKKTTGTRRYIPVAMLALTGCATAGAPMVDRIGEQPQKMCDGQEAGCQRQPQPTTQPIGSAQKQVDIPLEPIEVSLVDLPLEPLTTEAPKQKRLIPTRFPGITLVDGLTTVDPGVLTAFTSTAKASRFKAGDTVPLDEIERVFGKMDRSKPTIILIGREWCGVSQMDKEAIEHDRLSRKVNTLVFMEDSTNRDHPAKKLFFDGRFDCPTIILLDKTGAIVLFTNEIGGHHGYRKEFADAVKEVIGHK